MIVETLKWMKTLGLPAALLALLASVVCSSAETFRSLTIEDIEARLGELTLGVVDGTYPQVFLDRESTYLMELQAEALRRRVPGQEPVVEVPDIRWAYRTGIPKIFASEPLVVAGLPLETPVSFVLFTPWGDAYALPVLQDETTAPDEGILMLPSFDEDRKASGRFYLTVAGADPVPPLAFDLVPVEPLPNAVPLLFDAVIKGVVRDLLRFGHDPQDVFRQANESLEAMHPGLAQAGFLLRLYADTADPSHMFSFLRGHPFPADWLEDGQTREAIGQEADQAATVLLASRINPAVLLERLPSFLEPIGFQVPDPAFIWRGRIRTKPDWLRKISSARKAPPPVNGIEDIGAAIAWGRYIEAGRSVTKSRISAPLAQAQLLAGNTPASAMIVGSANAVVSIADQFARYLESNYPLRISVKAVPNPRRALLADDSQPISLRAEITAIGEPWDFYYFRDGLGTFLNMVSLGKHTGLTRHLDNSRAGKALERILGGGSKGTFDRPPLAGAKLKPVPSNFGTFEEMRQFSRRFKKTEASWAVLQKQALESKRLGMLGKVLQKTAVELEKTSDSLQPGNSDGPGPNKYHKPATRWGPYPITPESHKGYFQFLYRGDVRSDPGAPEARACWAGTNRITGTITAIPEKFGGAHGGDTAKWTVETPIVSLAAAPSDLLPGQKARLDVSLEGMETQDVEYFPPSVGAILTYENGPVRYAAPEDIRPECRKFAVVGVQYPKDASRICAVQPGDIGNSLYRRHGLQPRAERVVDCL